MTNLPGDELITNALANEMYWNSLADEYQTTTRISCHHFHLGPLLPDAASFGLLPENLQGKMCLEIGSGAGQNSLFLASQGAICLATDIAEKQLNEGRRLAADSGLSDRVSFQVVNMDDLPLKDLASETGYDLIHSTYALPFADNPALVIHQLAGLLKPGGQLLITTGHPLFAGEWIELDENEEGLFLTDYFNPPPEVRFEELEEGDVFIASRTVPIGLTVQWLLDAGLVLEAFLEPEPLPVPTFSMDEIARLVPYSSPLWIELYPQIAKVPVVAVFSARKPNKFSF